MSVLRNRIFLFKMRSKLNRHIREGMKVGVGSVSCREATKDSRGCK